MNYNNKFPTFSFRIERYQDQKITKLASQEKKSRTEFAKDIKDYLKINENKKDSSALTVDNYSHGKIMKCITLLSKNFKGT